ncbi:MAG: hypothetical protein AB7I04_07510 [Pseudomonadales bacterium]
MTCNPNVILREGLLGLVLLLALPSAWAEAPDGCSAEVYRALDFWLGRWEVHLEDGRRAGANRIESSADGCLIRESWTGAGGGEGYSMSFYDPTADRWRQVWVSAASLIEIAGGPVEDGSMVLSGEITYRQTGDVRPFRGRWTPMPDGRVRQFFEELDDEEGWQSWFDGIYTKVLE